MISKKSNFGFKILNLGLYISYETIKEQWKHLNHTESFSFILHKNFSDNN